MAIKSGRLPGRYVLACVDDPAIDWIKSAELLKLDADDQAKIEKEADAAKRNELIEDLATSRYVEHGPTAELPLAAKDGEKITEFICRPLTHDEFADVCGYAVNPPKMWLASVRLALVEVKNWGDEEPYTSIDDLPKSVVSTIGTSIFLMNKLAGVDRDF